MIRVRFQNGSSFDIEHGAGATLNSLPGFGARARIFGPNNRLLADFLNVSGVVYSDEISTAAAERQARLEAISEAARREELGA